MLENETTSIQKVFVLTVLKIPAIMQIINLGFGFEGKSYQIVLSTETSKITSNLRYL